MSHYHWDHVDGLPELRDAFDPVVIGSEADADRLPVLDIMVNEGDTVQVGTLSADVLDVSGHTINHLAFHFDGAVFTGDSLMALGCGRIFEGTPEMMWESLQKLAQLPEETAVYSGHEYTQANAAFAITIDPGNDALSYAYDFDNDGKQDVFITNGMVRALTSPAPADPKSIHAILLKPVADHCNLRCKYCYEGIGSERFQPGQMSPELVRKVIAEGCAQAPNNRIPFL